MNFHREPNVFVSHVHLKVADLQRSLLFYQQIIGFQVIEQTEKKAILSADGKTPLVTIEQPENIRPKQPRTTGLYHFALLLPSRSDLAKVVEHFIKIGYPLQGASDHLVSEALYLADPDGNGIEIYADRPASTWKWNSDEVVMSTDRLDIESILAEGDGKPWNGLPAATLMGHVHLHVSELHKAEAFYCKGLGFDIVTRYGGQALFISTGRYHHHIGLNTWNGVGAPAPSEDSVGLKNYTLVYPNEEAREHTVANLNKLGAAVIQENGQLMTEDPSGNRIILSI
jgi:catechol 2,3-dioxygenase